MNQRELTKILELHKKWLNQEVDGIRANLSGANLTGANLTGANLSRANLSGANLSRINLYKADLSGANLFAANLSRADLSRINLYKADLSGANLSGADLSGADLSGADLSGANLYGVISDYKILKNISVLKWNIIILDNLVKVGCQEHSYEKWLSFSDKEIAEMGQGALEFYKNTLLGLLRGVYKGTKWEIKE